MISSEVQRTLVKSPPELWSELSDPDALARHLGALGEIRITRTQPESLVEWEAQGASGSVEIKPSGWGTKVRLIVKRELTTPLEPAPAQDADAAPRDTGATTEPTDGAAEDSSETAPEPSLPTAASDAEQHAEPDETAPDTASPAYEADAEPEAAEPEAAEPEAAEPEAAGPEAAEPPVTPLDPLGQTIEIQAVMLGPETYAGDRMHHPEDQPEQQEPEAPDALVPRRGFFARLFGWRRRSATAPEPGLDHFTQAADAVDGQAGSEASLPAADEQDPSASGREDYAPAQEPSPAAEPASAISAIESLQARFTAMAPEPEASAEPEPQATPEAEATAEPEPDAFPEPEAAAEPEPHTFPEPEPEPEPSAASKLQASADGEPEQPQQPRADLAGELAAAEEVAAEEVTAVLTAVLDRLGAAHHRPFSRS